MKVRGFAVRHLALFAGALVLCGLFLVGCDDERVTMIRDRSIPVPKHATWAWRPEAPPPPKAQLREDSDKRPVTSRDEIAPRDRRDNVVREPDADQEAIRQRVRTAIEQQLTEKGFKQVSDPAEADFLVDYHFAVRSRNVLVPRGYGGYPGVVCGPFGCWNSWGWGPPDLHYEDVHFRAGTFVFDFVKRNTHQRAYRAIGQESVRNKNFTQDEVNAAIHHLLKGLKGH